MRSNILARSTLPERQRRVRGSVLVDVTEKRVCACLISAVLISLLGCGYHQVGSARNLPASTRTMAVPIFASKVQAYATEVIFTQAVVRELNTSTRFRVMTNVGNEKNVEARGADAVLHGTVLSQSIAPLTYDAASGQTSSYLVTITAKVVIDAPDGHVLYENDAFGWREQYQSTQDLSGTIQEDSAAVRRVARDFAHALVSDMLGGMR